MGKSDTASLSVVCQFVWHNHVRCGSWPLLLTFSSFRI